MERNECTYVYVWRTVGGLGAKEVELTKGETSISPRKSSPPLSNTQPTFLEDLLSRRGRDKETRSGQRSGQEADKKRTKKRTRGEQEEGDNEKTSEKRTLNNTPK